MMTKSHKPFSTRRILAIHLDGLTVDFFSKHVRFVRDTRGFWWRPSTRAGVGPILSARLDATRIRLQAKYGGLTTDACKVGQEQARRGEVTSWEIIKEGLNLEFRDKKRQEFRESLGHE